MAISKEDKIGDVINKHPEAADIMLKHGLHCVGCGVAYWESIEDGCKGHGISGETIDKMVKEINDIKDKDTEDEDTSGPIFSVSDDAAEKLKELLSEKEGKILRVGIIKGDSGERYMLEFVEDNSRYKIIYDSNMIKIVVEDKDYDKINRSKIDYVRSMNGAGFKISKIER